MENKNLPGFVVENYWDNSGKLRQRLKRDYDFNDDRKAAFLEEFAKHGRIGSAAKCAGVSLPTLNEARKNDPEFAELMVEALQQYQDKVIAHHQNLLFEGEKIRRYDKEGNLVAEETRYPIRLIELELKKVSEDYRDKRTVDHNVQGGVLFVEKQAESTEDWENQTDVIDMPVEE